jgi:FkbM family methyltransferase
MNKYYYLKHEDCILQMANGRFIPKIIDMNRTQENFSILNFILKLPTDSVFVDVGCWKGDTTIYIAENLKKFKREDIQIICIDPSSSNIDFIQKQINELNIQNIIPICSIVTDQNNYFNPVDVTIDSGSIGNGLRYQISEDISEFIGRSLDEILKDYIGKIRFIKIDVEGHEQYVLGGASEILKVDKPDLYIEIWNNKHAEKRLGESGINHTEKIISHLKDYDVIQKYEKNYLFRSVLSMSNDPIIPPISG